MASGGMQAQGGVKESQKRDPFFTVIEAHHKKSTVIRR
jgi:hypothetical protein